jgi:hypothetical protein
MSGENTDIRRGWLKFIRKRQRKMNGASCARKTPNGMPDMALPQENGGNYGNKRNR